MSIAITIIVIILVAYGMLKQYNPQAVLLAAGVILFISAYYFLGAPPVEVAKSKGLLIFDIWEKFAQVTNNRLASVGLTLVSIAGVATYLNKIGASAGLMLLL